MIRDEKIFLWVLIINALIAASYLLYGCMTYTKGGERARQRGSYVLRSVCIILCPLVSPLFFGMTGLFRKAFFHGGEDISDIEFSKERVRQRIIADEKEEGEMLPIQEAMLVSTPNELRRLMMTALKNEDIINLNTVALAVRSEDSETAHYAGSLLSKALDVLRSNIQTEGKELYAAENDEQNNIIEQHDLAVQLVKDMNFLLQQQLLPRIEQELMIKEMVRAGELAWQIERESREEKAAFSLILSVFEYSGIAMRLTEIQEYEEASIWCGRAMEAYPKEAESYKCLLRLKYQAGDNQGFLDAIASLKRTGIPIDKALMEMIRLFRTE